MKGEFSDKEKWEEEVIQRKYASLKTMSQHLRNQVVISLLE